MAKKRTVSHDFIGPLRPSTAREPEPTRTVSHDFIGPLRPGTIRSPSGGGVSRGPAGPTRATLEAEQRRRAQEAAAKKAATAETRKKQQAQTQSIKQARERKDREVRTLVEKNKKMGILTSRASAIRIIQTRERGGKVGKTLDGGGRSVEITLDDRGRRVKVIDDPEINKSAQAISKLLKISHSRVAVRATVTLPNNKTFTIKNKGRVVVGDALAGKRLEFFNGRLISINKKKVGLSKIIVTKPNQVLVTLPSGKKFNIPKKGKVIVGKKLVGEKLVFKDGKIIADEVRPVKGAKFVGVEKAPKVGFIGEQGRERERLRTKMERGKKLTLKEEAFLAGRTFVQGVSEFGVAIVALPATLISLAKNPAQLKNVPSSIARGGERFGQLLRTSPTEAFVKIGTEIFLLKGSGKAFSMTGKVSSKVATRLSPRFRGINKGIIKIPSKIGKGKKIEIKVGGSVSKIKEPLAKQAALAGEKTTAVSAQADRLVNFIRRKRIVRKPIPGESTLSRTTKSLLKKFDDGKINKKQLISLDNRIRIETKGAGNILERSFFADPRGRFRPSRLGVGKQKDASLLDVLSGDVTFKTSKPQILVFEDIKVQGFPKSLSNVAKKLKSGKTLTQSEAKRLLQFQSKKSGKFKPVGALSKEPEITLAPGEIIRRKKTIGVTLINGKKVSIVRAEVVKATKTTSNLIKKSKAGKITSKELKQLASRLEKETRFKSSISRSTGLKPRARISKIVPRRKIRRTPKTNVIKRPGRLVKGSPEAKAFMRKIRRKKRQPARSGATKPSTRKVIKRSTGRPPQRPPVRSPPRRPPQRPPARPPAKPPVTPRPTRKVSRRRKVARRKQAYKVLARPIKKTKKSKKPKLIKVSKVPLTKRRAGDLRNYIADTSLARTARIKKTGGRPGGPKLRVPVGYAKKTRPKFRTFRIVKGKRKPLPKGTVIERRNRLLDTRQEKQKITLRGRMKQITPKRKPAKSRGTKTRRVVKKSVSRPVVRSSGRRRPKITGARRKQMLGNLVKARRVRAANLKRSPKRKPIKRRRSSRR